MRSKFNLFVSQVVTVIFTGLAACGWTAVTCAQDAPARTESEIRELSVDGSVLPFAPTPSASTAGITIEDSAHKKRVEPRRLAKDAPNILVILIDDVGPGTPTTYGGEISTPTLTRVAKQGVSYNRFHSTAMCSPTRAALLTGRNHTRVGNGQIAEFANDWDGFSGIVPKSSATVAEVLKHYGYRTAAWGKWHNTPSQHTSSVGPFDYWPTGYGFEYFYGFLGGEASQYEPNMVRNTTIVNPRELHHEGYHLSEDIAEDAVEWLRQHQALAPDKPFMMYWATGASHGPHHVATKWANKYKGKFDDGWDQYRERVFAKQKQLGWIPKDAKLTPRPATLPAWDSIPEDEKPFQRRLMEVFAGFSEHADAQAGKLIDEIERQGQLDNTLIFYIWGDNGSSAEGQNGTISELLAQNGIPSKIEQHIDELENLGGLDALGGPKTDNMYHAGWAWAGSTPYKSTKLVAAHFGGTRQPMAVSWPRQIHFDETPRPQFHHVVDIVPTIYEAVKIDPPRVVNGVPQDLIDGVSMGYTFSDPLAEGQRKTQFFDIMGSRGIYHDGWYACTFGPRTPWLPGRPNLQDWNPLDDQWELYNLETDWTQASNLASTATKRLSKMKQMFLVESTKNKNLPIGGGLWTMVLHPEDVPSTPYTEWTFGGPVIRIPEASAPKLGTIGNRVEMEIEVDETSNGVLYSMGGFAGGMSCYISNGVLCYEYNLFHMNRVQIRAKSKLPNGKVNVEVESRLVGVEPGSPMEVTLTTNGEVVAQGKVPVTVPVGFSANDCLDIGSDWGSPVSKDYYELAPYSFSGTIGRTRIKYLD